MTEPNTPVRRDFPNILLVNPWIHDFAAYDFWAKPMGLLTLAGILRRHDVNVFYIDCLDRFHPRAPQTDPHIRYGRGPYMKRRIAKPSIFSDVPRYFSRYGIIPEWFREDLSALPAPDLVLVTSIMTYWYPGAIEAIRIIKDVFPASPVVLGGIYATLCTEHAVDHSGADLVVSGAADDKIFEVMENYTVFSTTARFDRDRLDTYPYPAFDLQRKIAYVPILTSRGCPFRCPYCASRILAPSRMTRSPESVVEEIHFWQKAFGVKDFVFYDDALLVDAERHAIPILEKIITDNLNVRFHTPNAVHIRGVNTVTSRLMFEAGFKTLRLGLETVGADHRENIDEKATAHEFRAAASALIKAGFKKSQVGAYLLAGLPGQSLHSLEDAIQTVKDSGITPVLAYYSPIPRTALWKDAVVSSRYDLEADPLFSNNAVFPCRKGGFSWDTVAYLKQLISSSPNC